MRGSHARPSHGNRNPFSGSLPSNHRLAVSTAGGSSRSGETCRYADPSSGSPFSSHRRRSVSIGGASSA